MPEFEENPTQYMCYVLKFCPDFIRYESVNVGLFVIFDVKDNLSYMIRTTNDKHKGIKALFGIEREAVDLNCVLVEQYCNSFDKFMLNYLWENPYKVGHQKYIIPSEPIMGLENKPSEDVFENLWKRYVK